MTVDLPSLIFRVRATVAEISVENMDDLTMYREIQKASFYIEKIKDATVVDADLETPIVCLAAYYSHVNYTLLNARRLGTIDESYLLRQLELKRIAKAMLLQITSLPLTDDLAVDETKYEKIGGIGFALTNGVLNDTNW